ncbi:hypothetical protein HYT60_00665 [Candidatus Woesebacteria bacterium]|nr:hypothetical protein [Candidatus Woesebacteria bacterium]
MTSIDFTKVWSAILQIGSISGLITLIYTVLINRKNKPGFKFGFRGSSRQTFQKDKLEYCRFDYNGIIRNKSEKPNTITSINLVVWENNKKRDKTLSFGHEPTSILDVSKNKKIRLPVNFKLKEARHFHLKYEIALTGSHDEQLIKEREPLPHSPFLSISKYDYKLIFEDVNENLFDDQGALRSREEINLWWTLPNTFKKLQNGNFLPFIKHYLHLQLVRLNFRIKRVFFNFGFQ